MSLCLSVPSKTFIIGEYLAAGGGPSLLINTEPRFQLILSNCHVGDHSGIDPHSPAGKFILKNAAFFNSYQLEFKDPHAELGGLGASSAQFLLLYAAFQYKHHKILETDELLNTYWEYTWQGKGIKPSGADVISQFTGDITYFHFHEKTITRYSWPFTDLNLNLYRTSLKIPTHEYLLSDIEFSQPQLHTVALSAVSAFRKKETINFIAAINDYQTALTKQQLTSPPTLDLIATLKSNKFIQAIKGCGAMGADVILILNYKADQTKVDECLKSLPLSFISDQTKLSTGLSIKEENVC